MLRLEEAWSQPTEGSRPWGIILASAAGAALAPLGLWGFSGASELRAPEPLRVWASVENLLNSLPATESGSAFGVLFGVFLVFAGALL